MDLGRCGSQPRERKSGMENTAAKAPVIALSPDQLYMALVRQKKKKRNEARALNNSSNFTSPDR